MIDPPLQPYVAADILDDPPEVRQFLQDRLGVERVNSRSVIRYLIEHLPDLEENFQDPEFIETIIDTGENIDSNEFKGHVEAQIEATDYYPFLPAKTDSAKDFYLKLLNHENQLDKDLLFDPDILERVADQLDDISKISGLERFSREELLREIILPLATSQAADPDLLVTFTPYLQELPDEELDSLMVATSAGDVESPGNVWFNNDLLAYDIESIFGTDRQYLSHQYTNDVENIENSEDFFSSIGVNTGKTSADIVGGLDHLSKDCD